jgi:hypothetical protein
MRKFVALAGMAALLLITPEAPVAAAVINPDSDSCVGQVPNADGILSGPELTGSLVIRDNKSWTTMTCHFDVPDNLAPAKATHARDFECGIVLPPDEPDGDATIVQADETRASASSGGRMVMTCRLKKS